MTQDDDQQDDDTATPKPAARPGRVRRAAGAAGRMANWFVPINTTKEVAASTAGSLGRIGSAFTGLFAALRNAWVRSRQVPEAEDIARASEHLKAITPADRIAIQKAAQRMWAAGAGMVVFGVALLGYALLHPLGVIATLVYTMSALLWAGFGVGYAVRAAADWHALERRAPISGMTVLRDVSLWLPKSRKS